jgi:quercetin dioxygenase-like cupin family protein
MKENGFEKTDISKIVFKTHEIVDVKQVFKRENFEALYVELKPGKEIPLHTHEDKDQAVLVLKGEGTYTAKGKGFNVSKDSALFVKRGIEHGFKNTGDDRLCYFEMGLL